MGKTCHRKYERLRGGKPLEQGINKIEEYLAENCVTLERSQKKANLKTFILTLRPYRTIKIYCVVFF